MPGLPPGKPLPQLNAGEVTSLGKVSSSGSPSQEGPFGVARGGRLGNKLVPMRPDTVRTEGLGGPISLGVRWTGAGRGGSTPPSRPGGLPWVRGGVAPRMRSGTAGQTDRRGGHERGTELSDGQSRDS